MLQINLFLLTLGFQHFTHAQQLPAMGEAPGSETSENVCSNFTPESTESALLERVLLDCYSEELKSLVATPENCNQIVACVASSLVNLTLSFPCEEENIKDEKGVVKTVKCDKAATVFVLVETFRKLLYSAMIGDNKNKQMECEVKSKLLTITGPCVRPMSEGEDESKVYGSPMLQGHETFVRKLAKTVGKSKPIAGEIRAMEKKKFWQGAIAVTFTFACPGLLAIFSLPHAKLVLLLQLMGMLMIFLYVYPIYGTFVAVAAVFTCLAILLVQFSLMIWISGETPQREGHLRTD